MATYKEIHGLKIRNYTTNPDNPIEGQLWYNTTDNVAKYQIPNLLASWRTSVSINTARDFTTGAGTTTSALCFGGLKTPVDVSGISMTMTQGNINLVQTTVEQPTGQSLTSTLGQHAEIPGQIIGVSGLSITSSLGEEGITGDGQVTVSGQSLTSSVGGVNITAWSEVDLGVSNNWTVVDLAA